MRRFHVTYPSSQFSNKSDFSIEDWESMPATWRMSYYFGCFQLPFLE